MLKPLALAIACLTLSTSLAQQVAQAPPVGYTGELVEYSDTSVTLKDKDGKMVTVAMTPGWFVSSARQLSTEAIHTGSFVATANTNIDANSGKANELRIFEPNYRPEEGTHLMQGQLNTSMTHGTVKSIAKSAGGVELDVVYPDGSRHIIVPSEVRVTGYDVHARSTLKPGTRVSAVARKGTDGVLRAGRLNIAAPLGSMALN